MLPKRFRLIARLDIKGSNLIKGIHLEGLRVIGDPQTFAKKYYLEGADELIYIDSVASLYNRNGLVEILKKATSNVFIPITAGGGVRTLDDVKEILRSGADKVAINTAAIKRPELIREVSKRYGAQCMVLSVEAKKISPGKWEAFTDNGRERTGVDVVEWVQKGEQLGAGEILLTSVDNEGTKKGFDVELYKKVSEVISIPLIASGGFGKPEHLKELAESTNIDAVAIADAVHYNRMTIKEIRLKAIEYGLPVRSFH